MKNLWSILFLFLMTGMLSAQVAEDIVTDSDEVTESTEGNTEEMFVDDIVQKRLILENRVLPYEPIREADIPWEKRVWRVIDVREKQNKPFVYPGEYFINILTESVMNGDIAAFSDEKFENMLTGDDIAKQLSKLDTVTVIDPETYEERITVTKNDLNPEDIKRFRVKEVWFFDEESAALKVRILGIAPILDTYDQNTGEFKYSEPMFWMYYPQSRDVLAGHRVFNELNDASPMTWDDLFQIRKFSSYIMKASNVRDMRLVDIHPDSGYDRLMESDRIKAELFNFEHDLWSY